MRRLVVVVLLVLALTAFYRSLGSPETGTGSLTLPTPAPAVGDPAPNFRAKSMDGSEFELSEKGIYVLTFWSTMNQGSSKARPSFDRLAREYGDDGVSFVAVYVNSIPGKENASYTTIRESTGRQLTSKYNVKRVPRLFVIQDDTVKLVHDFYDDDNDEDLSETLKDILAKRQEDRKSTAQKGNE